MENKSVRHSSKEKIQQFTLGPISGISLQERRQHHQNTIGVEADNKHIFVGLTC